MKCLECRGYDSLSRRVYIDRSGNILSEGELTDYDKQHSYKKAILCGVCYEKVMGKTDRMFEKVRRRQAESKRATFYQTTKVNKKVKFVLLALLFVIAMFGVYMSYPYFDASKGSYINEQTQKVVGNLVNKKEHTYVWPDGTTYEGEMKKGKLHGKGTITWPNGDKYSGDFFEGEITGTGALQYANGGSYVGEFLNGLPHGQGTMFYSDNTRVEGIWVNGEIE